MNGGHVDPDLVSAARLQAALHIGVLLKLAQHLVVGHGPAATGKSRAHLLALRGMPPDRRINGSRLLLHIPVHNRLIPAGHRVFL